MERIGPVLRSKVGEYIVLINTEIQQIMENIDWDSSESKLNARERIGLLLEARRRIWELAVLGGGTKDEVRG